MTTIIYAFLWIRDTNYLLSCLPDSSANGMLFPAPPESPRAMWCTQRMSCSGGCLCVPQGMRYALPFLIVHISICLLHQNS
jgi:hypothetical protein